MKRLDANRELLALLGSVALHNPDLRFGQLLITAGVIETKVSVHNPVDKTFTLVDPFYEESATTLDRVRRHTLEAGER